METTPTANQRPGEPPGSSSAACDPEAWDEAFLRAESYLHAHRLPSRVTVNRIANSVIAEARRSGEGAAGPPVTAAMQALFHSMARWYGEIFAEPGLSDEALRARGRLALLVTRTEPGWPGPFLGSGPVPPPLGEALRQARLESGPEMRRSKMPPAPLEFSIAPAAGRLGRTLGGQGLVKAAALWLLIIGFMGVTWAATH